MGIADEGDRGTIIQIDGEEVSEMIYAIAVVLLVLWLLGFFAFHVGGSLIHILLVLAVIVVLWNLVAGRRAV